jgi:Glycosyltransferases, probably involved in cell wall biogenesis
MSLCSPKVSVIMKVYNGERFLREAVDSVLSQTFTDFEFLILDDGSQDSSAEIIKSYTDERIRLIQNAENQGIVAGQNQLIAEAKGEYIAVLDCDDISYPDRLQRQVEFLDSHPNFIFCGTYRYGIKDGELTDDFKIRKLKNSTLKFMLYFTNPITHSSLMFRSSMYREDGISYGPEKVAEDYGAIVDMAMTHPIAILPERLVAYRVVSDSVSNTRMQELLDASINIRIRYLDKASISSESKGVIKMYYHHQLGPDDAESFLEAVSELAESTGADIQPRGNAFEAMCDLVTEYIQTVGEYSPKMWRTIRNSDYKHLTSIKTDLGRKFLAASMMHIKRG